MNDNTQKAPYLPLQRNFLHKDPNMLSETLDKSYVEIASRVNERSIGTYAPNTPLLTGDKYYMKGQPQSSQRQLYMINSTASIPHNIIVSQIGEVTKMYGQYTDGANWYALQPGTNMAIAGQVTFYIDSTNINFLVGAGAPVLTRGTVVIEWIPNL